jgi:DNA-directed RNA polymerase specialized sigma24 family protein
MRSPKLSNDRSRLRRLGSIRALKLTRDDLGFASLRTEPERQIVDEWTVLIGDLRLMARRAVSIASRLYRQAVFDKEEIEQEIILGVLETKPRCLISAEKQLLDSAYREVRRRFKVRCREVDGSEKYWDIVEATYCVGNPAQELYIEAMQAVVISGQLPSDLKTIAMKLIDGCNPVEIAEEMGLSLLLVMTLILKTREIAHRLLVDGLDAGIIRKPIRLHQAAMRA